MAELGPGLEDAEAGVAQRQVLPIGRVDQRVEHRVFENGPPVAQVGLFGCAPARRPQSIHCGRHRRRRPFEIGTHLEAVVDVLRHRSAAEQAKHRHQPPRRETSTRPARKTEARAKACARARRTHRSTQVNEVFAQHGCTSVH